MINDHPSTLYVIAAGNDGRDNDVAPTYPCDIDEPNIVCVGATTNRDEPADFSNHGDHSVDLFAPGEWVVSTMIPSDRRYAYMAGTSMARRTWPRWPRSRSRRTPRSPRTT